ncbi:dTDP-glucose 4,6-dehydratase [Natronosporangium hydrolyticum]|uniref:dTDP-glucose 4,6-dehydratase n=1 Tax=Natronosporangium hydrolyticum TaxID=2811111 RepID=A0A895YAL3_9ACTN|nr:dTDP-glucose 4,6-dehydratase [Natronosporangium hydrolyticum]QSB13335.1 dTDP-glucose 4,6-dehydratase [Natronosporangium hydrolyticum]
MKILVTGGAGFIGSHFVRQLLTDAYPAFEGAEVTVLDRLTYSGNRANLDPVAGSRRLRFLTGDICDPAAADEATAGRELVVHFAAESHVDRSIASAEPFVRANLVGTQVLLDAALRHRVSRFVHVSTDEVYGSIDIGSWREDQPVAPRSPYSASKAGSDLLALSYHHTHGLPALVTRCSNNYGPYQYPEKVIPLFITNLLDGRPVPLYGDGGNVRDWLHVDDHCTGIALAAQRGQPGELYHIGGGVELTNKELTGHLLDACGAGWDMVRHVDDRKGHDRRYSLDTTKACSELGYRPRTAFPDGLAATVRWYHDHRRWWEPLRSLTQ